MSEALLPPALATPPGGSALCEAGIARWLTRPQAARLFDEGPVLVAHAAWTARRLGLAIPARSARHWDVLELFAFVRPGQFCAPTPAGLARVLGFDEPQSALDQALALAQAADLLLAETRAWDRHSRAAAGRLLPGLARAGWPFAEVILRSFPEADIPEDARSGGLDIWSVLAEWEEQAPMGEPGTQAVSEAEATSRLSQLLERAGLDEARPSQAAFAGLATQAFLPRDAEDEPKVVLSEAGTGIGKTLGYLSPASVWAEKNGAPVWVSTYTRALQRQIDREGGALYPDPALRARKMVVRKGRENYLCLLNYQEMAQGVALGVSDAVGLALTARWVGATRDGDMTGGDYPAWIPSLFSVPVNAQASAVNLVDRRGECVHAACPHYRTCFVEKAIRGARRADVVVANHALVLSHAAFEHVRTPRPGEAPNPAGRVRRIIFDEGHHLFEAADSAFSACLSGIETAELRRWIRGPETRGRRGRGLEQRLGDLIAQRDDAAEALRQVVRAAAQLPGEGWSARICPSDGAEPDPSGPVERLLRAALDQIAARTEGQAEGALECSARPPTPAVIEAARDAARALAAIEAPLLALARALEDLLDDEASELDGAERARLEGALRGLERRARLTLPAWRGLLQALQADEASEASLEGPAFIDSFTQDMMFGRVMDAGLRRHWVDPTIPLEAAVIRPSHGVLIASATLTDGAETAGDPFHLARLRTGTARLKLPPIEARFASPFRYAEQAKVIVVTDVARAHPRQTAAAMRELFLAAGGGALGLFTAIRRLRAVYDLLAGPLGQKGLSLYAQHVDPLEVGALVDVFRSETHACLLGTDAVRDGIDVPGESLRLIVFDKVPWARPDLLHKARRQHFGDHAYDDALARARITQAFGRLIRRADDRGVFVMLDAAAPSRLFSSLPGGVSVSRLPLVEALEAVQAFLASEAPAQQG